MTVQNAPAAQDPSRRRREGAARIAADVVPQSSRRSALQLESMAEKDGKGLLEAVVGAVIQGRSAGGQRENLLEDRTESEYRRKCKSRSQLANGSRRSFFVVCGHSSNHLWDDVMRVSWAPTLCAGAGRGAARPMLADSCERSAPRRHRRSVPDLLRESVKRDSRGTLSRFHPLP
jgi:hypothetical protein